MAGKVTIYERKLNQYIQLNIAVKDLLNWGEKNLPQKLLIIGPQLFFDVLAQLPKRPRNRNSVPPKAP